MFFISFVGTTNLQMFSKNVVPALPIQKIADTTRISPEMMENSKSLPFGVIMDFGGQNFDRTSIKEILGDDATLAMFFLEHLLEKIRKIHSIQSPNKNVIKGSNSHMLTTFRANFKTE